MTKPSSFSSFNTSSFTEDFVALWSDLLCRLSLTYTYLSIESRAVDEIFTFVKEAEPKFLPADHSFRTDFDEFRATFTYGLQAFSKNRLIIEKHAFIESEYFNKMDLTTQAEKVYFDRLKVLEPACAWLPRLTCMKDAKVELLNITNHHLQGKLTSEGRAVEETKKKGLIKLLA